MSNTEQVSIHSIRRRILSKRLAGRVFISGTGRAGTTFLMQLLTELGLDTGYPIGSIQSLNDPIGDRMANYFPVARAGFERDPLDANNPMIVKSPFLCDQVDRVLESGILISNIIIPVRDLFQAAQSRRSVQANTVGFKHGERVPGGLWDTTAGGDQECVLAFKFAKLIEAAVRNAIPVTFLCFPRLALDPQYTFEKLQFLLPFFQYETFNRIFFECSNPELIHDFRKE